MRLGVIDVGSNSIKVTLAELAGDEPIRLKELRYPVRLGRGVFADGNILAEDTAAAISALMDLKVRAKALGISEFRAVATSALREARNAPEFLAKVLTMTGINIRVISGEEEAHIVAASTQGLDDDQADRLLIDIGGGSTEIIHMTAGGELRGVVSLPLGAVRLAEWLGYPEIYQADSMARLKDHIAEIMRNSSLPVPTGAVECLGTGGTISSLIDLTLHLKNLDGAQAGQRELTAEDVEIALGALQGKTAEELTELLNVQAERAAILPAGAAVLGVLVEHYGISRISMRRCGLRDGLIQLEMAEPGLPGEKVNKS